VPAVRKDLDFIIRVLTMVFVQGSDENEAISDEMLNRLLDRTHLAKHTTCPYPSSGPGYELIEEKGHGLLTSVV